MSSPLVDLASAFKIDRFFRGRQAGFELGPCFLDSDELVDGNGLHNGKGRLDQDSSGKGF